MNDADHKFDSTKLHEEAEKVKAGCEGCVRRLGSCMWGGFAGDCPMHGLADNPKGSKIREQPIVSDVVSRIREVERFRYATVRTTLAISACDIIDRQAEEIATYTITNVELMAERDLLAEELKAKDAALKDIRDNASRDTISTQWIVQRARQGLKGSD